MSSTMTREWSAIILAGGKGSRLMPLTSEIPKPLVKVTNKPMIDYSIAHLIYADIKHIILALAYMGEDIKKYIKNTWTPDKLGDVELECEIHDIIMVIVKLYNRINKSNYFKGEFNEI